MGILYINNNLIAVVSAFGRFQEFFPRGPKKKFGIRLIRLYLSTFIFFKYLFSFSLSLAQWVNSRKGPDLPSLELTHSPPGLNKTNKMTL